ncbi:MAG: hypothetical protein IH595_11580 [Bacteroidales bacterium]|nr:hypothetical protein [Bacteroidales bacterium]
MMNMEQFKQDLDELFRLFNKLMEKQESGMEEIPGINKMMLQQFKFFFNNYEQMKDQIAYQLQGQFGESVQDMVRTLIQQLREELGEDEFMLEDESEESSLKEIYTLTSSEPIGILDPQKEIEKIDELLKNKNLTPEQIDQLLDRRSNLK